MPSAQASSEIGWATNAKSQVEVKRTLEVTLDPSPVYLCELITLCPWFLGLYDHHLEFEETWRDTVSLKEQWAAGSSWTPRGDAFYLHVPGEGQLEMPLVTEGLRKFAMLARLISTGSLFDKGYVFWDEPEKNLNPKLVRVIAHGIVHLAAQASRCSL